MTKRIMSQHAKKKGNSTRFSGEYLAQSFLEYFENAGHTVVPSAGLVPDDPTLLFTAAGMVPFKSYYGNPSAAPYATAASVQKCLRAGGKQSDLENVGRTVRHHTFFEMLGNFSFGDYFKREAIDYAWELCVDVWGLDRAQIWISVYEDDDEASDLWHKHIGIPKKRIVRLGKKDNFWGPVGETGVCGPSSEMYFDTGQARGCKKKTCGPGCDCDRYIEFWNLVFPQFNLTSGGKYDALPKPGIDTGMGLERLAFILQEVEDNFHTDLFLPIRNAVEKAIPKKGDVKKAAPAVNATADHVRALVFALSEGIMPSNDGRGYVLRRLLRRALTKMHPFGVREPFLAPAVDAVIETMGARYPELNQRAVLIRDVIMSEEERFLSTIEQGMNKLHDVIDNAKKKKDRVVSGRDAFVLYDTYGFPFELTRELADDAKLSVDEVGFAKAMEEQKDRARGKSFHIVGDDSDDGAFVELRPVESTEFVGYDDLTCDAEVGLFRRVDDDDAVLVDAITNQTVFYPEGGGQVGDVGTARFGEEEIDVVDAFRRDNQIIHRLHWKKSELDIEDFFKSNVETHLAVDRETRLATTRNHTATHLIHAALRKVLGTHVSQAGSLVAPDRMRFDFHHHHAMTDKEVVAVQEMVNQRILDDMPVESGMMPYKEAIARGAMALFGEKYSDVVRVVSIGDFSKELCGGTHLRHTGEIGMVLVTHESAVAAGVRRIEALTGKGAVGRYQHLSDERSEMARLLRIAPEDLAHRVQQLFEENERLRKALGDQERKQATSEMAEAIRNAKEIDGVKFVVFKTTAGDVGTLRTASDQLRAKLDMGVGLLCLAAGAKAMVLIVTSDRLMKQKHIKANELAKEIAEKFSIKGGGKPHLAQMGLSSVKDVEKIESFLESKLKELAEGK